ncbi:MarR family winged helix-turn-helix transcriptional regulator [Microbacterium sp.]|uniref:MarR family winged helix-turn-helix transcriptional regulator n=1 Tax=Microbacterium sp. TaxID=51671 RepID=UPI003A884E5D
MSLPVPRMNPEQARAWMSLVSIAQLLPATLDQQLTEDAGVINFEYGILAVLNVATDRTLRLGELVSALAAPYPRVSKGVSRLEARGLVERIACAGDRRAINVHLTREGRKTWLKATPPHIALARDTVLGALDPGELTALADILTKINERLDPEASLGRHPG